jgi:hypothetical protein
LEKRRPLVPWTEREDALICRLRSQDYDLDEIAAKLPHRTPRAVKGRFARLIEQGRITSQRAAWTPDEDALLCALRAKDMSAEAIATHLNSRTVAAISQRIQQLRLDGRIGDRRASPVNRRPWSHREESLLVRMRGQNAKLLEIAAKLPNRTRDAVSARVRQLLEVEELDRITSSPQSYRSWSREEDELITLMRRAQKTTAEMATALDRTVASVKSRISQRIRKGELPLGRRN